jgi:leucyl aminopeptidase
MVSIFPFITYISNKNNMELKIKKTSLLNDKVSTLLLCTSSNYLKKIKLTNEELDFVKKSIENKQNSIAINQYKRWVFIEFLPKEKKGDELLEALRRQASKLKTSLNKYQVKQLIINNLETSSKELYAFIEGLVLSHYSFLKYFDEKEEKANKLEELKILSKDLNQKQLNELISICESVYFARRLVNEPLSYLTAKKLADEIKQASKEDGFSLEILGKKQIESLNPYLLCTN